MDRGKSLPCQQDGDGDSQAAKETTCSSIPTLPEDILHHVHSILPLRDAARGACSSRAFLRSWRCHPVLALNRHVLGPNTNARPENFSRIIDNILSKHSGIGVKIFKLDLLGIFYTCHYLDNWLQIAVTPGIEELSLKLCHGDDIYGDDIYGDDMEEYNFPCTLLSDGVRNSIRDLQLSLCAFHPTSELAGPLVNLTNLALSSVRISGDELECFLSNSPALKQLYLNDCKDIVCLKIPCVMLQLQHLEVSRLLKLRVIESKARNLSSFYLPFGNKVKVSLGETMQMKTLVMQRSNIVCYARCELASSMPNLESLSITSNREMVDTPMLPTKFAFLRWLFISLRTKARYDYFSLVSFLDASPSLETWLLDVVDGGRDQDSIFEGSSEMRQMPERRHARLKTVEIQGFNSTKGLVELTCYILMNAAGSLKQLKLDTTFGDPKCDHEMYRGHRAWCTPMTKEFLMTAHRGVLAIREYIEGRVPPAVELTVVEHCRQCHAGTLS